MKLLGRSAIITGGSTGLGLGIARAFLANGATVAICGRDEATLAEACENLRPRVGPASQLLAAQCDVSRLDQVRPFVSRCIQELGRIDILVNNAGVLGPMGKLEDLDLDQWRATFDVNLFGTVSTIHSLLPHMKANGYGKIINLSGGGATAPRPFVSAYAASKVAVVRLTETVAEELRGTGIDVNAVAPGALNTRMLDETLEAGPDRIGAEQFAQVLKQQETGGNSIHVAADLCVYLGSADSDGITGKLISAAWDPWRSLHDYREQLSVTDIYTLRRIRPEDRNSVWK
jgi:NAD(P)-dependent dehydrogenase (short-subunit alcohol dehydrogenase family)